MESVKKRMEGIMAKSRQLAQLRKASLAVRWHIQILSMRKRFSPADYYPSAG